MNLVKYSLKVDQPISQEELAIKMNDYLGKYIISQTIKKKNSESSKL